jgi:plastocyanin
MRISKFFDRNKPIFLIAAVMALIFLALILFYGLKPKDETGLSEITDSERSFFKVSYEDGNEIPEEYIRENSGVTVQPSQENTEEKEPTQQEIDSIYGTLEISYTEDGFKPGKIRAALGQVVSWTNETDRVIYFHQRKQTYPELKELKELKPGESFSFRLTELGIWTYDENESGDFGSIEVKSTEDFPAPEKIYSD